MYLLTSECHHYSGDPTTVNIRIFSTKTKYTDVVCSSGDDSRGRSFLTTFSTDDDDNDVSVQINSKHNTIIIITVVSSVSRTKKIQRRYHLRTEVITLIVVVNLANNSGVVSNNSTVFKARS